MLTPSNMVPCTHSSRSPKRRLDRFSLLQGSPFYVNLQNSMLYNAFQCIGQTPLKLPPFPWEDLDPHPIHGRCDLE